MKTLRDGVMLMLMLLSFVGVASAYMHTAAPPPQGRAMATATSRVSMRETDSRWERPARNRYGDDPRPCRRLQWRLPQIRRRLGSRCVTEEVMPPPGEVGRLSTVRQLSSVIAHEHVTTRRPGSDRAARTVRRPELATHGSRRPRACAPLSSENLKPSRALAPWSALRASAIAHPKAPAL